MPVVPGPGLNRQQTHEFLVNALQLSPRRAAWLDGVMQASAIQHRYTCVDEFLHPPEMAAGDSPPEHWERILGGLSGRMDRYVQAATDLGEAACRQVLRRAGAEPCQVTHLIYLSCTGFRTPGPDLHVMKRLGLADTVHRLQIGFMGCQASVQGLRAADAICRSEPEAVVLVLSVELGSLHFDASRTDRESLIVSSLFADGAAASLMSRRSLASPPDLHVSDFASFLVPETSQQLTWAVENPAFRMGLQRQLPSAVGSQVARFAQGLAADIQADLTEIGWAIHPGGRAILDSIQQQLALPDDRLVPSRHVLANYGNMSSPTIQFVLNCLPDDWDQGLAMAIGPGISLEGFSWNRP